MPLKDRGKYQGYFMSVFGVCSVLGPVVGGFFAGSATILGIDGWRWVFLVNIPIALAALVVVWIFLHLPAKHVKQRIDYWGAGAVTLALVPLLIVAEQGRSWGWTAGPSLLCFGLGLAGVVLFIVAEKLAGDSALIPLRFFRIPAFGISALLNFIIGIGMFGAIAMIPMYLQLVKGLTPTQAGLMMITFTVGILIGSISSGQAISRTGTYRIFPILGTLVLALSSVAMGLSLGVDTSLLVPGGVTIAFGLGLGFCMQPLTLSMQMAVPPKDMGVGTSTAAFFRSMGGTVGTAVFISMLFSSAADKIGNAMGNAKNDPHYLATLKDPAVLADPNNKKLFDFFKNGASNDSLNDTSWLHQANPTLTFPIRDGFAQSIDLVMLTAAGSGGRRLPDHLPAAQGEADGFVAGCQGEGGGHRCPLTVERRPGRRAGRIGTTTVRGAAVTAPWAVQRLSGWMRPARPHCLDDLQRLHRIRRVDGHRPAVPERGGQQLIKRREVAALGGHRNRGPVPAQRAPVVLPVRPVTGVAGQDAGLDLRLLAVSGRFGVAGLGAQDPVARPQLCGAQVHPQVRAHPAAVVQCNEGIVVGPFLRAPRLQFPVHLPHRPEQLQRLVNQVRAQVVEHAAAGLGGGPDLPWLDRVRGPALQPRFEAVHLPQRTLGQQLLQGQELPIPTAVLVAGQR